MAKKIAYVTKKQPGLRGKPSKKSIELEKKLRKKVDVVTYDSLNPLLKDRILREEVRIL